tara:strand:- start:111 stop:857 length:747 start_codon:yes stop_codon:yes gene_type:complete
MENKIFSTTDYTQFSFFDGNAKIKPTKVNKITESIKKYGLINPIVVDQNGNIIDGQHRFEGCKTLQIAVRYFVKNIGTTNLVELVRDINSVQKNWNNDDIAYAYSTYSPNKEYYKKYLMLRDLGIHHSTVLESTAFLAEGDKKHNSYYHTFKNGNLVISDLVFEKVKGLVSVLRNSPFESKIWNKAHFFRGLLYLNKNVQDFSIKRLCDNYKNHPQKWMKASTYDEHKKSIVKLYNHANKNKIKILFG